MVSIKVLGVDPALRNVGLALCTIDLDEFTIEFTQVKLIETSSDTKKTVRKNSEDLERARHIWKELLPLVQQADVLAVEIPVGSQSARAMCSYGVIIGLLAAIDKPLIQVTASEVKAVTGNKNASKQQVIDYCVKEFKEIKWLTTKRNGKVTLVSKNEHIADAICAVEAGLQTDQFKMIENTLINLNKGNLK